VETEYTPFMHDLEVRFKQATHLSDRSHYKIFYGQIRPARILTLGINPGGVPANTNPDGRTHKDGVVAASSATYFENDEHDILDCEWRENNGLRRLLTPLLDGDSSRIRTDVVKTNLAFRRSAKTTHIDVHAAMTESAPFLMEIMEVVRPELVLLTGPALSRFNEYFSSRSTIVVHAQRDERVKQVVFAAARSKLHRPDIETLVIQVAHASQFSWTYEKHGIVEKIRAITAAGRAD
jgi:hypothetical protein